ncbi:MAG TPA: hypothetical protein VEF89_14625 [Solirubrobacteraceae bacterium]|nr:hypothetical protein [Solirubrobacteraceae bacterium]
MATTNHRHARHSRRHHRRLIRTIVSEWAVVVAAHAVAVTVLMVLEQLLHISPCAR